MCAVKTALSILTIITISYHATAADITVLACKHSKKVGNVEPVEDKFGGLVVCHGEGGMQQWKANIVENRMT